VTSVISCRDFLIICNPTKIAQTQDALLKNVFEYSINRVQHPRVWSWGLWLQAVHAMNILKFHSR